VFNVNVFDVDVDSEVEVIVVGTVVGTVVVFDVFDVDSKVVVLVIDGNT
jgi:hypothetical protein